MAGNEDRTFAPNEAQTNRARTQGLGVGQQEMDQQRDPNRFQTATNPRDPGFEGDLDGATNADRPTQADFGDGSTDGEDAEVSAGESAERRDGWGVDPNLGRNEAGLDDVEGDLGAGTPPNVDIHKLGQSDNPEEDWGEAAEGAVHSSTNTNRGGRTELERGQGAKTRAFNRDMMSRRT
jgi:hypothetical protein